MSLNMNGRLDIGGMLIVEDYTGVERSTATGTIDTGVVDAITVTEPGNGYLWPPIVTIIGDGTGATGYTTLDGNTGVLSVTIVDGGTGYTTVTIVIERPLVYTAQKVIASDGIVDNFFGSNVALDSNGYTMAVGAYGASDASREGAVYVYTGPTWAEEQKITLTTDNSYLGWSTGISDDGTVIIAGEPFATFGTPAQGTGGNIQVFERSGGPGTWALTKTLKTNDVVGGYDELGYVMDLTTTGDIIVAGVRDSNAAFVWHSDTTPWGTRVQLTTPANPVDFGTSIATSSTGEVIVVGNRFADSPLSNGAGTANIFRESAPGSRSWSLVDTVYDEAPNDPGRDDYFGNAVDCSDDGTTVVVGAPRYIPNVGANDITGAAFVYEESPANTWSQTALLLADDGVNNDQFGQSVSINNAGTQIVVGAGYVTVDAIAEVGASYVFTKTGGVWGTGLKFVPHDPQIYMQFGGGFSSKEYRNSVAITGDGTVFAGGAAASFSGLLEGSVYTFPVPTA